MNPLIRLITNRQKVFSLFAAGILYSLYIWPLLNAILCISLGAYWLLFCKKNFNPGKPYFRLVIIFVSLYLPYALGILYSANKAEGYFRLSEHLAFILFPIVFGFSRLLDKKMVITLLSHFVLSCTLTALTGFLLGIYPGHIGLPEILQNENHFILGKTTYPYIIGLGCLLSLMIIGENLYKPVHLRCGLVVLIFLFLSFYLLFLNVRLLSFCWFALMIYFIFRRIPSSRYRLMFSTIMLIILATVLFKTPVMKSKWDELFHYQEQSIPLDRDSSLGKSWGGTSIRIALWKCGKDLIVRHPILGVGTGDVQDSLQQAYEDRKFYFASRYNHYNLHNQYLQFLAAFGLFGFLILMACILAPVILLRSGKLFRIRLLFLTIFFLICFSEVILDTTKGIVWYSFFNSIFAFGDGVADE
jgi:O-antigen ligase